VPWAPATDTSPTAPEGIRARGGAGVITQRRGPGVFAWALQPVTHGRRAGGRTKMHLDVEKNLKAAALKGGALGASQVCRPLVQVVLHRELDVLVLPRAHARLRASYKSAAPMRAQVIHFTLHTLLLDASRNSFIRRCDMSRRRKSVCQDSVRKLEVRKKTKWSARWAGKPRRHWLPQRRRRVRSWRTSALSACRLARMRSST
jgi:hypothetical protein